MQELVGSVLEQLLGPQSAEHPLLDAAALRQSPPELVVVVVGAKARPTTFLFGRPSDFFACDECFWPLRVLLCCILVIIQCTQPVLRACASVINNNLAACCS